MTTRCEISACKQSYPDRIRGVRAGDFFYVDHPTTKKRMLLVATSITSVTVARTNEAPWTRSVGYSDNQGEIVNTIAISIADGCVWSLTEDEPVEICKTIKFHTT